MSTSKQIQKRKKLVLYNYFRYIGNRTKTTLANHIWNLKENNEVFSTNWTIELSAKSYTPEAGFCNTCATEKYMLIKHHKIRNLTNRRSEIMNKCRHRNKFLLSAC